MRFLVFDLESVPNPEVPWEPPKDRPDAFPPIHCHKVVSIGVLLMDSNSGDVLLFENVSQTNPLESAIIRAFLVDVIGGLSNKHFTLVGFNSRGFDWPVIIARAMRYGIPVRGAFDRDFRYRYSESGHLDLADDMSDFGACHRPSLLQVCQNIGLPGKVGVDGGDVKALYEAGALMEIDDYCLADVLQTAIAFARWLHVKGRLNDETYNHFVKNALAVGKKTCGSNSMVGEVIKQAKMEVLLLPPSTVDTTEEIPF
jgi:hypothetical protein